MCLETASVKRTPPNRLELPLWYMRARGDHLIPRESGSLSRSYITYLLSSSSAAKSLANRAQDCAHFCGSVKTCSKQGRLSKYCCVQRVRGIPRCPARKGGDGESCLKFLVISSKHSCLESVIVMCTAKWNFMRLRGHLWHSFVLGNHDRLVRPMLSAVPKRTRKFGGFSTS
jgi:hypothetical protein